MDSETDYYGEGWAYLPAKEREEAQAALNRRYSEMLEKLNAAAPPAAPEKSA